MFNYSLDFNSVIELSDKEQEGLKECINCYCDYIGNIEIRSGACDGEKQEGCNSIFIEGAENGAR